MYPTYSAYWVTLYSRIPPPGDNIPVTIEPFAVEDGVPTDAEIELAVKRLRNNRAGRPSRMRAEDLKGWLAAARRGEKEREAATKTGGGKRTRRTPDKHNSGWIELCAGVRTCTHGVSGQGSGRGGNMAGGGTHPEGEMGLPGHRPCGGDVERRGGDFKSPFHFLHHLPRRPPWILGRSRHGYRQPRGQAVTTACSHEGGGPLRDLPGPD